MKRSERRPDPDRYLQVRGGFYTYRRRVPVAVADLDERYPTVKKALGTDNVAQARKQRDMLERADDEYWSSLIAGLEKNPALAKLKQAEARAHAMGYTYRHIGDILAHETPQQIADRLISLENIKPGSLDASAVIGAIPLPKVKVSEAIDLYIKEIVADEIRGKSPNQRRHWEKIKRRAVANFIELVSDKPIDEITRDDARKLYNHWLAQIAPAEGKATRSASSGNRDLGNMRVLYDRYMRHMGIEDIKNPFNGLSFSEKKKKTRPPFSTDWITSKILKKGSLASLNRQARGILLTVIETGCRPSEIANLRPENIRLNEPVPYINIETISDPNDPREIKTQSSTRRIPLIGVALAAMKAHPKGFPNYKDKEDSLSGTLNKYFRENNLFETPKHKIYSLRHAFEDRMKAAGLDTELRMILMGHANDRPKYGEGGTMEWRRQELLKIELPFDPSIV